MDKKIDRSGVESGSTIFHKLFFKQAEGGASSNNHKAASSSEVRCSEKQVDASLEGMAYTRMNDVDAMMSSGEYVKDHSSLLSLQPWIFRRENNQSDEGKIRTNGESNGSTYASQAELSPRSVSLGHELSRGQSSLRSRRPRRWSIKPLTSVENCLIPQLYNQQFEIKDYVFSSFPSSTASSVRPLIITDGNRVISKSSSLLMGIPFENQLHKGIDGVNSGLMEAVVGIPPLPKLNIPKQNNREMQHGKFNTFNSQGSHNFSHSKDSPDRMLLFVLGINIGVISTIISNRREMDRLNGMLKHTENLVQDLQEELEMKESLTVEELTKEAFESQGLNNCYAKMEERIDSSQSQVPASYSSALETNEYNQTHLPEAVENSESMSKIEAELEAELERLELNMSATSLEGRMSALGEVDPDFIATVVHGDLRADILDGGVRECQADADGDSSSTSTTPTHNANCAVSPRELSLRLHEVIRSRLEERIKELEKALDSQKQLHLMEAEQDLSQRAFSNSDMGSSSNQESPTMMRQDSTLAQPLHLNLAGDALSAYDEAYKEFMRIADTEENLPATTNTSKKFYEDGLCQSDRSLIWGMEGSSEDKSSTDTKCFEREPSWDQMLRSRESNDAGETDEDSGNDTEDEEGKMLIQQIVERTRQGSPVVIHAQRMLFSMDE